jgi:hypothetical protein
VTVAIYIRWSTDDQGTGTTLDVQRDGCLKWANDHHWRVDPAFIFIDQGVSGAKRGKIDVDTFNDLRTEIEADKGTVERNLTGKSANLLVAQAGAKVGEALGEAVTLLRPWEGLAYAQRKWIIHLLTEQIVWDCHCQRLTVRLRF